MKSIAILITVITTILGATTYAGSAGPMADRAEPAKVKPVIEENIEYRAPQSQMGCVEAWQGKALLWRRQIYVVKYSTDLERDVQGIFITTLESKEDMLIVRNERSSEYHLDLTSLQVKVVKGALIETLENAIEKDRKAVDQLIRDRKGR